MNIPNEILVAERALKRGGPQLLIVRHTVDASYQNYAYGASKKDRNDYSNEHHIHSVRIIRSQSASAEIRICLPGIFMRKNRRSSSAHGNLVDIAQFQERGDEGLLLFCNIPRSIQDAVVFE